MTAFFSLPDSYTTLLSVLLFTVLVAELGLLIYKHSNRAHIRKCLCCGIITAVNGIMLLCSMQNEPTDTFTSAVRSLPWLVYVVLILLTAIIIRIIHVGIKSGNNMNRLICVGIAGMLASQTIINVGVCLGIFPVVGLTLPFFSYGGSSIVTMFLAMGIVSGIHMRPAPDISAMYIRPKFN